MSTPINTILSWFETGDFPTQQQFEASWTSFRHKDESIPMDQVENLNTTLQGKVDKSVYNVHLNSTEAHNTTLAKLDASNLNALNVQAWKTILGVGDLPSNIATVDDGTNLGNVYTKIQSDDNYIPIVGYTNDDGKILADMIEALGITDLIEAVETTIAAFAANSVNYNFQKNDFIAIPSNGAYSLYMYKGGSKTAASNYLPTGLTNITIAMVEGLQAALDAKLNKPTVTPNYLLFWNNTNVAASSLYYDGSKFGVGTTTPTEMLHLNNGRLRSKALVFDENTETLPNQITLWNRRFHGTDLTGTRRILMYRDYDDYLSLLQSFSQAQKDNLGTVWNGQYSNGSLNVYSITPTVMKNDHVIRYLVLQGLNLNVNPASTSVKFIPTGNAIGTGEIDCLGFQTFADGKSMVVSIYGDSLPAGIQYNLVIRTTSPITQTHRTTSSINVVTNINSIDLTNLNWQTKAFTSGQEGTIFTTNGGLFAYSSSPDNKAYMFEPNTIVGAVKSDVLFGANTNFYLEFNLSLGITGTNVPSDVNDFYGYLGLINNSLPIALADNSFIRIINSNFRSGGYSAVMVYNNTITTPNKIELGGTSVLNANIIIMRTGNIYTQFMTVGSVTIVQSISSTTEAISLSLAISNGTTKKSINGSIVQAFTF